MVGATPVTEEWFRNGGSSHQMVSELQLSEVQLKTNGSMHKIGIATSGTCSFCGSCDETLTHLLIICEKNKGILEKYFEIFLDPLAIMFGISNSRHSQ